MEKNDDDISLLNKRWLTDPEDPDLYNDDRVPRKQYFIDYTEENGNTRVEGVRILGDAHAPEFSVCLPFQTSDLGSLLDELGLWVTLPKIDDGKLITEEEEEATRRYLELFGETIKLPPLVDESSVSLALNEESKKNNRKGKTIYKLDRPKIGQTKNIPTDISTAVTTLDKLAAITAPPYDGFIARTEPVEDPDDSDPVDIKESIHLFEPPTEDNTRITFSEGMKVFDRPEFAQEDKDVKKMTPAAPKLDFFTYKALTSPTEHPDDTIFVYTGQGTIKSLQSCYMRWSDLYKRLHWSTVPAVYANDRDRLANARKKRIPNGAIDSELLPFPLWTHAGDPINNGNEKPFNELIIEDKGGAIDQRQFVKYLKLAASAAQAAKTPYSVIARFWDIPKGKKIDHPVLIKFGGAARQLDLETVNRELATHKGLNFKPTLKPSTETRPLWKAEAEYSLLGVHPLKLYELWVHNSFLQYVRDKQGSRRAFPKLENAKLAHQVLTGKAILGKDGQVRPVVVLGDGKKVAPTSEEKRTSLVTHDKLFKVLSHKREDYGDQKKVMNGISATQIAKIVWGLDDNGKKDCTGMAEWLHRSAWSFGGVTNNPGSSQTQENLVFGTVQCNTTMIRYENAIKRAAERGRTVLLKTRPFNFTRDHDAVVWAGEGADILEHKARADFSKFGWLGSHLRYEYSLDHWDEPNFKDQISVNATDNAPPVEAGVVIFDTMTKRVPTRMEAILDEIVERLTYHTTTL